MKDVILVKKRGDRVLRDTNPTEARTGMTGCYRHSPYPLLAAVLLPHSCFTHTLPTSSPPPTAPSASLITTIYYSLLIYLYKMYICNIGV